MVRIVATAENFAYGPSGKLMTVAEALLLRGHEVTFLGTGTAYELARRSKLTRTVCIDTESAAFITQAVPFFRDADVVISCVDRPSAALALDTHRPLVWLDPLFWWWEEIPEWILRADLYLAQRSIDAQRNTARYASLSRNFHWVGPIVNLRFAGSRDPYCSQLLVNFGGGEAVGWYRLGRDTNYPYVISRLLVEMVDLSAFSRVIVAGNASAMERMQNRYGSEHMTFRCLGHEEFLRELSRSAAMLTVPGLESPLDGWSYGVPTLFLPPSNSSQYVQLDEYIRNGVGTAAAHFRDILPPLDFQGRGLREKMGLFLEQLVVFERDGGLQRAVAARIQEMLRARASWPGLVAAGQKYVQSLGGVGLDDAVHAVEDLTAGRRPR